jgi:hypothetical protein
MKFKLTLTLLAIVKLWLVAGVSIMAIGDANHDERLFLNLADSLLQWLAVNEGNWLGTYNQLTLVKGPVYPLFLATNFAMGLPLLFTQVFLYILSGLILILGLRKIIPHPIILIFLYTLYIFSPEIITRVIREGIYSALTVLIIAGLVNLYVNKTATLSKFSLWAVFLGIVLSAFWMTREEGIWIMPSFLLILGYILWHLYRNFHCSQKFIQRAAISILPLVILLITIQLVSLINKIHYDVYTVVEVKAPGFLSAYGALYRVKPPHFKRYLPVPKAVRQAIYAVSPTFKELEPFLEGPLQGWGQKNCHLYPDICGDIGGGWFMWALRDAVAMAGYYQSGSSAENYYWRLAQEINAACDEQQLDCIEERATMTPPFRIEYIPLLGEAFFRGVKTLLSFPLLNIRNEQWPNVPSRGTAEALRLFRDLTRDDIVPLNTTTPSPTVIIRGWAFSPTETVYLRVQSRDSSQVGNFSVQRNPSPDVDEHFKQRYVNAKNSRFTVTSTCMTCQLVFYTDQAVLATINLSRPQERIMNSTSTGFFHIDSITVQPDTSQLPRQNQVDAIKIKILQNIAQIYHATIPGLFYLALVLYFFTMVRWVLARQVTFLWILNTAILGAILFKLLILSYLDITSFLSFKYRYLASLYPLLLIFIGLTIVDALPTQLSKWLGWRFVSAKGLS